MILAGQTLADLALGHCSWLNPLPVAWHDALAVACGESFSSFIPLTVNFVRMTHRFWGAGLKMGFPIHWNSTTYRDIKRHEVPTNCMTQKSREVSSNTLFNILEISKMFLAFSVP